MSDQWDYDDFNREDDGFERDMRAAPVMETSTLTVAQYQETATRTLLPRPEAPIADNNMMVIWNAIGLAGEAGEIANLVSGSPHLADEISDELGDMVWYISAIATKLNLSLEKIVRLSKREQMPYTYAEIMAIRLFVHTGKVCDLIKKGIFHRHGLDVEEIEKELVGCMRMIRGLCGEYRLALRSTIMTKNLTKLQKRYKSGFTSGESINRAV